MSKARITEVFHSIQGEGKYTGYEQVFVRFFECNMHCVWCDTPHSIGDTTRHYKEYGLEELMAEIQGLWPGCDSVSLTGGEPLMQVDFIQMLLPLLKQEKMAIYLETNGVLNHRLETIIDNVDIVAMDFKLPSSTGCRPYWEEHESFLKVARRKDVFIKAVVSKETFRDDVVYAAQLIASIDPNILFILQPNYYDKDSGVLALCAEYQDICRPYLTDVRIMRQMHKEWKIR